MNRAISTPSPIGTKARQEQRRACDRCHASKERCIWEGNPLSCERCRRLGRPCETTRRLVKPGRKPRGSQLTVPIAARRVLGQASQNSRSPTRELPSPRHRVLLLSRGISPFDDLPSPDQLSLVAVLDKRRFMDRFVLGSSFHDSHLRAFLTRLQAAMPLLKDALLACAGIRADDPASGLPRLDEGDYYHKAASGLNKIISFRISSAGDLSLYLVLALGVLTFNIQIIGARAFHICRYTLPALKPLNDCRAELIDEDDLAFLLCILNTELMGCLFRHQVPCFRSRPWPEGWVDRYLGVSPPLLGYGHDLCVLSQEMHQAREKEIDPVSLVEQLHSLESAISTWRPTYPDDFLRRFSQAEVAHMLAQAQIFRNALLLVSHRLQHPFGTGMERARVLSDTILEQFDMVRSLTNKTVVLMDFAYLVASFELDDSSRREDTLRKIGDFQDHSMTFRTRFKAILNVFWQTVDAHSGLRWIDLNEHLVSFLD